LLAFTPQPLPLTYNPISLHHFRGHPVLRLPSVTHGDHAAVVLIWGQFCLLHPTLRHTSIPQPFPSPKPGARDKASAYRLRLHRIGPRVLFGSSGGYVEVASNPDS